MSCLFIDTSSFFVTLTITKDDKILASYDGEIKDDMSSKILPIIRNLFESIDFELKDINKIFVVNGPGSFTGLRVGVTIAKVMAWALKIDIIPISSLEFMATTQVLTKYVCPMIDARRGYVYAGKYDSELNKVMDDSYTLFDSVDLTDATIVSYNDINGSVVPNIDVLKIINKHINDIPFNPHNVNPNYLKLTEAEEKLMSNQHD